MEEQSGDTVEPTAVGNNLDEEQEHAETVPENIENANEPSGSKSDTVLEKSIESSDEVEQSDEVKVDPTVIEKLTLGVLEEFLPNLQKAKSSLNEVLHNQEVLIETVQQENSKFTESTPMKQLIETMQEAKLYHTKLVNLKREMNGLMDKSTKLKRRAVKLQQEKQKDLLKRADRLEKEHEREQMLTAKVAKPSQKKENTQT